VAASLVTAGIVGRETSFMMDAYSASFENRFVQSHNPNWKSFITELAGV